MSHIDSLAAYDSETIGREFASVGSVSPDQARAHQRRRDEIAMSNWKQVSAMSDSQRIPKSSLKNTCNFDTKRASTESFMTWSVFVSLAAIAGMICAMVIRQLSF